MADGLRETSRTVNSPQMEGKYVIRFAVSGPILARVYFCFFFVPAVLFFYWSSCLYVSLMDIALLCVFFLVNLFLPSHPLFSSVSIFLAISSFWCPPFFPSFLEEASYIPHSFILPPLLPPFFLHVLSLPPPSSIDVSGSSFPDAVATSTTLQNFLMPAIPEQVTHRPHPSLGGVLVGVRAATGTRVPPPTGDNYALAVRALPLG